MSLLTLMEHLPKQIRPVLLTYADGELVSRARKIGVPTRVVPRGGALSNLRVVTGSAAWFREVNARIIHVNTLDIRAGLAARMVSVPLIGHLRVIMPFTYVDRWFVKLSDSVISVSKAAKQALSDGRPGVADKLHIIPNPVASLEFNRSLRKRLGLDSSHYLVGSIGRFDPVKGFEYLIDAIGELSGQHEGLRLVLIGGPGGSHGQQAYARMLEARVASRGLEHRITFTGFLPDAASLLGALDLLVVPSVPHRTKRGIWEEGFGRVAAEGMSAGLPVVVSRSGGLAEIIEDNVTGKVVPPEDSKGLALAIEHLCVDRAFGKQLGKNGRQVFEQRSAVARHVENTVGLYEAVLGERK